MGKCHITIGSWEIDSWDLRKTQKEMMIDDGLQVKRNQNEIPMVFARLFSAPEFGIALR